MQAGSERTTQGRIAISVGVAGALLLAGSLLMSWGRYPSEGFTSIDAFWKQKDLWALANPKPDVDMSSWWWAGIPSGWVIVPALLLVVSLVYMSFFVPSSDEGRRGLILQVVVAAVAIFMALYLWETRETFIHAKSMVELRAFSTRRQIGSFDVGLAIYAAVTGVALLLLSSMIGFLDFYSRRPSWLTSGTPKLEAATSDELRVSKSASTLSRSGSMRKETPSTWSRAYVSANLALLGVLGFSLLAPMFRVSALGISATANAFRSANGSGDGESVRFWLTGIPVGWIVLVLVVAAVGVLLWATKGGRSNPVRIGVYLFAACGVASGVLILATWWYANRSVSGAVEAGVAALREEGIPFAELGSLVEISPDFGLWMTVVLALLSAGLGLSANWLEQRFRLVTDLSQTTDSFASEKPTVITERISLLKDIALLREQGVLSEEEFEYQKHQILAAGGDEATEID